MIRNKYIQGRGVRYYQHSSGIVNQKRSVAFKALTTFLVFGFVFGGGYFGLNFYDQANPVEFANQTLFDEVPEDKNQDGDTPELEPFRLREDKELAKSIKGYIKDLPKGSDWSVTVRDLNFGRMASVNSDESYEVGSLRGMFLLAQLEKKLNSQYWDSYIEDYSIRDCITKIVASADDQCSQYLGYYAGWEYINQYNQELGFDNTNVTLSDGSQTTSKDLNELTSRLQNSQILSDKARRLIFDAFYDQELTMGIPSGCGKGCLVGNIAGQVDDVRYDSAVVTNGSSKYVVTILTKGGSWQSIAKLSEDIDKDLNP